MPEDDDLLDDDLLDDLPPLGDDDGLLDEDSLGLDELIDAGDEDDVDLDDGADLLDESSLFALELPPTDDTDEDDVDAIPVEGLDTESEYGWVDDGKGSDDPWDPSDADLPNLSPLGRDDGGEEGVDDEVDLGIEGDDAVPHLPTLDRVLDDDEEELDLAIGLELPLPGHDAETEDARLEVRHLGPRDDDVRCVASPPRLAGGTGLYAVGPRCDPAGLAAHRVVSIAVAAKGRGVVVGTAFDGLFRSDDGDAFERVEGFPEGGAWIVRERRAERLWARSESGGLYRSLDEGRTWTGPLLLKPVVALVTPEEGGVVVLSSGRDAPPQLARSTDGGERWAALDGPPVQVEHGAEWSLATLDDHVAVAADTDGTRAWVSDDRGRTWSAAPRPRSGTTALALVDEGEVALYVAGDHAVARLVPSGDGVDERVVLDVGAEADALGIEPRGDGDGEARVHALVAAPVPGTTVLWVATGVGLFRVEVGWGAPS